VFVVFDEVVGFEAVSHVGAVVSSGVVEEDLELTVASVLPPFPPLSSSLKNP